MVLIAPQNFWPQLRKKLLKNRLSICVRNFALLNEPLNIFKFLFYFNPEVAHTPRLYGVKIRKIRAIEYLTLGHLKEPRNRTRNRFQGSFPLFPLSPIPLSLLPSLSNVLSSLSLSHVSVPCFPSYVPWLASLFLVFRDFVLCHISVPCLLSAVPSLTSLFLVSRPLSSVLRLCSFSLVRRPQSYVSVPCLSAFVPCLTWFVPCLPSSFLRPVSPFNYPSIPFL